VSYHSSSPDLRASDDDREAAIARLRTAALEGRLDSEELEERVAQAYAARWCSELAGLTADVTPPPPPPEPLVFVQPQRRRLNGLAVGALVASLFWWFGGIGSIAAVVMGHIALGQIARSRGTQSGRTAAVTGLAFGYFGLAVLLAAILW
jgi:hypothetical protein